MPRYVCCSVSTARKSSGRTVSLTITSLATVTKGKRSTAAKAKAKAQELCTPPCLPAHPEPTSDASTCA